MNIPQATRSTLYEKLGGAGTIHTLVEIFYGRVLADPQLTRYFKDVDMGRIKRHQALFLSQALGGPKQYDGRELHAAHAGLEITGADFDRVAGHLDKAMNSLGVMEGDRDMVLDAVGSLREQIVTAPDAPAQPADQADAQTGPQSLYDKLGGEATVKAVVDEFYRRLLADAQIAPVFAGVDMGRQKRHQALFLSQALGGPKQYDGRDMHEAHKHLRITGAQFDAVAGHLVGTLQHFQVEQADIDTIVGVVAPLREQVVTAPDTPVPPAPEPQAPSEPQSLYDKLGGEATVKAVVDEFYRRLLADAQIAPVFAGVDMGRQKRHQALFLSQALGGPKQYDGRDMHEAHKHLRITGAQFDAVAGHLVGTLQHFQVEQADIDTIVGVVAPLREQVVTASDTPVPPATEPAPQTETQSLYDKLGGEATVKAVVDEFYRRLLADARIAPVFAGVDMGRQKRHQALFLSQALGGPKQYDGRDMHEAHKHLRITGAQFDAVAGHLVGTLQHFQVGQADIDTIVGVVAPLREQIVMDPFLRWLRAG